MRLLSVLFCCGLMLFASVVHAGVSTLVADTKSGLILSSKNAALPQYPASLTKVMTLYLTFNALENGLLKMDDKLPVSRKAARQPRSKLYVKAGQKITVREAIMALIIISANDVAVVLAEALAPSEEAFAQMMTATARDLGLKDTTFKNASGLHNPAQVTTAQDMAVLTMAMINHFPQYYKLFAEETFAYRGRVYKTHNHVKKKYAGAEGLKTGYISAVGYNIISTAKRDNHRLVSVVIGQDTVALRDQQAMNLLDRGFSKIKKQASLFQRFKRDSKQSALNKKAVLSQPDMSPYLKIMAQRLDQTVKKGSTSRQSLLALAPSSSAVSQVEKQQVQQEQKEPSRIALEEENAATEKIRQQRFAALEKSKGYRLSTLETHSSLAEGSADTVSLTADKKMDLPQEHIQERISKENKLPEKQMIASIEKEKLEKETVYSFAPTEVNAPEKQPSLKMLAGNQTVKAGKRDYPIVDEKEVADSWGVQVGAFSSVQAARKEAKKALAVLNADNKVVQLPQTKDFFRSRIFGFSSRKEAKNACQKLKNRNIKCMPLSPVS